MRIAALVIDASLLPPQSDHRSRNAGIVPLRVETFERRFRRCDCALVVANGSASGPDVDVVVDLRVQAPLVPLALETDVSPNAANLIEDLMPDTIVTAPTTAHALHAAVKSAAALPLLERLARAIARGGYFEPAITAAVAASCCADEPVHTVGQMVQLSRLPASTFRHRWGKTRTVSPQEFLHALELIRAAVLWESGLPVKDIPQRLGISESTLKRRTSHRQFEKLSAYRLAGILLRKLAL